MTTPDDNEQLFRDESDRLFGIAYRMLGSVVEAEDAVQEAFVRWSSVDTSQINEPAAWLTTVVTRICIDRLRSAQHTRETYVGPWLPEPVATSVDPADAASSADSLTFAFLVVLESLSPLERAAFLLHDVFGHPHDEVARMLDRSPAAVRQLTRRAREHVESGNRRYTVEPQQQRAVTEAFLEATAGGDLDRMLELLAPDVTFVSDGGGVVPSVPAPLVGAERVAQMLRGFYLTGQRLGVASELLEINAAPGLWVHRDGHTDTVMAFEVTDGRITTIHAVRNPSKLAAFGPDEPA